MGDYKAYNVISVGVSRGGIDTLRRKAGEGGRLKFMKSTSVIENGGKHTNVDGNSLERLQSQLSVSVIAGIFGKCRPFECKRARFCDI